MEKHITQNGIKYELKGEQYYPMLEISEQEKHKIGKYGLLHRDYIKQHKRGIYITLLTEGKINAYLHEIEFVSSLRKIAVLNTSVFFALDYYGNKDGFYDDTMKAK